MIKYNFLFNQTNNYNYEEIFFSILKIRERGVLNRITERMLPEMPRCKSPTTFHSARLADVYSAFFILIAGGICAVSISIVERLWSKRRQMKETIVRGIRQHHMMPSHLPNFPRFPSFSHLPNMSHTHTGQRQRNEFSRNNDTQNDSTSNNEFLATSAPVRGQNSRGVTPPGQSKGHDVDSDEENDRPRLESKFFDWRGQSHLKRLTWSPFYGLNKKKTIGSKQKDTSGTVFPFHQ